MSIKLYLMRHGETEWNKEKRFQGQLDSPLTKEGIKKIENTGESLKNTNFYKVYTSEMGRAINTAKIVMEKNENKNVEMKKNEKLNEIHFGIWQGMTYDEILEKYEVEGNNYFNNVKNYNANNIKGETLENGLKRFLEGLEEIIKENIENIKENENESKKTGKILKKTEKNILIVTHGTVLELFLNYINDKDIYQLDERTLIENGKYKIFVIKNGKYIEKNN